MKQSLCRQLVIGVLALALPSVALADLSATTTLQANTALNLVTGATAASGGDILWNGSTITPQGQTRAYNLGVLGFDGFSESTLNVCFQSGGLGCGDSSNSHSAFPGETLTLWTTGLGADPADSDTIYAATPHSVNVPLHLYIGGVEASILYQGSAGYPGVNQINLTIPQPVPTGCFVSLVAVIGSVLNHVVTLPINNGGGACFEALTGLTGNQVSPPAGQTLRGGLVAIGVTNSPGSDGTRTVTNYADAAFEKYTGLYAPSNSSVSPGGCIVRDLTPVPIPGITGLDPGTITLTGPNGLSTTLASQFGIKGAFYANLAAGAIPQSGGTFTFTGSGGADVGPFTSTINFSPLLTWTNPSAAATIDRTQGLPVTWTGGNPGTYVIISGTSLIPPSTIVAYTCLAPVDAGQFTVPSYILSALPAGNGGTQLQNALYSTLSASGIDVGLAAGGSSYSAASVYK